MFKSPILSYIYVIMRYSVRNSLFLKIVIVHSSFFLFFQIKYIFCFLMFPPIFCIILIYLCFILISKVEFIFIFHLQRKTWSSVGRGTWFLKKNAPIKLNSEILFTIYLKFIIRFRFGKMKSIKINNFINYFNAVSRANFGIR